nr:retrovirus-related Pol polyprotein from transposon TNT 1-94 [Tanacetum cinerariifolium]
MSLFQRVVRIVHCVRKYCVSDLSSCAGSELGSELTSLAGSELGSELTSLAGSELRLASYRLIEDFFPVTCEQELCPLNFLLASCQVSSSELILASYSLIEDTFPTTCKQELCLFNFLLAGCQVSSIELSLGSYRPPMLDKTDFASWQQWIRLYCQGKENGVNILKLIDEGPFQMGALRETLTEGAEGALHLGPERCRVYSDLTSEEKDRYNVDIQATNILLQGLPKDIYCLINHYTDEKDIWDNVKILLFVTAVKLNRGLMDSNYDQLYAYLKQHKAHVNKNKMMLERFTQHTVDPLALMSNVFNQQHYPQSSITLPSTYGASAAGYEELRTELGMLIQVKQGRLSTTTAMENRVTLDEEQLLFIAGGQDNVVDDDVDEQPIQDLALNVDNVFQANDYDAFDSDYVKDNALQVVQSDVSVVPNDAYMMILNDMHEPPAQHVYVITQSKVVDKSLTAELATYKEHVELCERRARFELTEKEQKIDEQLRIVITDQEVTSLKKDFKQKQNQYLEEFLDMKALKEKVEDKLFKQDQSLQTVHMLCKPKPYYDEQRKAAICYKNPLCLTRAKQVQPTLYNGHEIIKTDHVSAIIHNSEDTLEIAKITTKKMKEKKKTPLWTHHKINIIPPYYSKANFLATFTPQTQLTPEQIFCSKYVLKMKTKALKEQAKAAKPIKALTVYPPNTPVKLVPRVLPIKNKVKINIFALIQLFSEFEKTCKKRITPMGLTKGERDSVTPKVLAPGMYAIDVEPIPPRLRNNREVHLDYLKHLKESVATLRKIVEEAKVKRPLGRSVAYACLYTKHSHELLEYSLILRAYFDILSKSQDESRHAYRWFYHEDSVIVPMRVFSIDKSMWSDQEKRVQKIDRLARSLLIQGLPNDIYSLIDSNKTAKDLWDALARHMIGSEYGEQDRKAAILYEYET